MNHRLWLLKIIKPILSCFFGLLISFNCYAFTIIGTWNLISIAKKDTKNNWESDCLSPNGQLIYTANGYMAVGISCTANNRQNRTKVDSENKIFYMGTYKISNNKIYHYVEIASDKFYEKKLLTREVEIISNNEIVLKLKGKNNKAVQIKWKRNLN